MPLRFMATTVLIRTSPDAFELNVDRGEQLADRAPGRLVGQAHRPGFFGAESVDECWRYVARTCSVSDACISAARRQAKRRRVGDSGFGVSAPTPVCYGNGLRSWPARILWCSAQQPSVSKAPKQRFPSTNPSALSRGSLEI